MTPSSRARAAVRSTLSRLARLLGRLPTRLSYPVVRWANIVMTVGSYQVAQRWPEIQDAVIEYARENGLDLVVASPVVYASASIDVTDAVLARLKRDFDQRKPAP